MKRFSAQPSCAPSPEGAPSDGLHRAQLASNPLPLARGLAPREEQLAPALRMAAARELRSLVLAISHLGPHKLRLKRSEAQY